jgi:hypothetical protein
MSPPCYDEVMVINYQCLRGKMIFIHDYQFPCFSQLFFLLNVPSFFIARPTWTLKKPFDKTSQKV